MNQHKVEDVNEVIKYSKQKDTVSMYNPLQINITDDLSYEFTKYLIGIADTYHVDILKSVARERYDIPIDEALDLLQQSDFKMASIKIVHQPFMQIHEYEKWEDGYIEGFVRYSVENLYDLFIWSYIEMKYLKDILEKFKDNLIYWK